MEKSDFIGIILVLIFMHISVIGYAAD